MRKITNVINKPTHTMWRPSYEISRMRWEINIYDDDDFPSVPHADTEDHRYKLDLLSSTGVVYFSADKTKYGVANKKEFLRLKKDIKRLGLIKKARKYYREHHPEKPLPILPDEAYSNKYRAYLGWKNSGETIKISFLLHVIHNH
ncbi:MAG: hypothetical protein PHE09_14385 [Oscillospiraceae bacterium]|nr:hypothetical protein [Oscillospiraceae bacterium]